MISLRCLDIDRYVTGQYADFVRSSVLETTELVSRRVYRLLAAEMAEGRLGPGERLPSERILCARLSVSRVTLRRALSELADDGLLVSSARQGSFVAFIPLGEVGNRLQSFTELGAARGLTASARVLGAEIRPATLEEAEAFGVAPGADVFELRRLRKLDGLAIAVDCSRVPLLRAPILPQVDFRSASLYQTLDACGAGPVRGHYTTAAAAADRRRAPLLGLAPGEPVLIATTAAYDANDRLVELAETVYRSDRYRFETTLIRSRANPRDTGRAEIADSSVLRAPYRRTRP